VFSDNSNVFAQADEMDLQYELYIDGSVEDVWNALISPEGIKTALFGSPYWSVEGSVGHQVVVGKVRFADMGRVHTN
jgi:uncharacterized protein YndB with AHSA1/START domain